MCEHHIKGRAGRAPLPAVGANISVAPLGSECSQPHGNPFCGRKAESTRLGCPRPKILAPDGSPASLSASVAQWQEEGRVAVWLHVPILQSGLAAVAASQGFAFHHAESGSATLTRWLGEGPSRLPGYATHQLGVAGESHGASCQHQAGSAHNWVLNTRICQRPVKRANLNQQESPRR